MHLRNSNQLTHPIQYHTIDDYVSHQEQKSPSLQYSRFKKMGQPLPFTKKTRSYKKHFINNFHNASNLKYLGTIQERPKLQSSNNNVILPKIGQEGSPRQLRMRRHDLESLQPHSIKLNIDHEVLNLNIRQVKQHQPPPALLVQRRRIKTQLENPENYFRQYLHSPSKELRKWNPTYLTEASNPLLAFLPKIR